MLQLDRINQEVDVCVYLLPLEFCFGKTVTPSQWCHKCFLSCIPFLKFALWVWSMGQWLHWTYSHLSCPLHPALAPTVQGSSCFSGYSSFLHQSIFHDCLYFLTVQDMFCLWHFVSHELVCRLAFRRKWSFCQTSTTMAGDDCAKNKPFYPITVKAKRDI